MLEHGTAVGWKITPLGHPVMSEGKPIIAAWIEVSEQALHNVRRTTGVSKPLAPVFSSPAQIRPESRSTT
jgi:acyl-homoserine lactone synthase